MGASLQQKQDELFFSKEYYLETEKKMRKKRKGLRFKEEEKGQNIERFYEIGGWVFGILLSILLAFILVYSLGMKTRMIGDSMEPELKNGQEIFMNRIIYGIIGPERESVIVFKPNGNENSHYYVKRVVAVPGDKVVITGGVLYVNGEESPWVTDRLTDPGIAANEFTIQNGEYFCIGDNPGNSEDSRSANIGPVREEDIIGKVWFRASCEEAGMGFVK